MKLFIISIVGLMSSAAMAAFPAQGDDVKFAMTQSSETASATGTFEEQLTSLDTTGGTYSEAITMTVQGMAPNVSNTNGALTDLTTSDAVAAVLANCAAYGGTAAQVTVPAGTFSTCAMPVSQTNEVGTFWIGMVPFGLVQADFTLNGTDHIQLALTNYSPAQK